MDVGSFRKERDAVFARMNAYYISFPFQRTDEITLRAIWICSSKTVRLYRGPLLLASMRLIGGNNERAGKAKHRSDGIA